MMIHLMKQIDETEQAGCETPEDPGRVGTFVKVAGMVRAEVPEPHMG
jgi:hypothetical protein